MVCNIWELCTTKLLRLRIVSPPLLSVGRKRWSVLYLWPRPNQWCHGGGGIRFWWMMENTCCDITDWIVAKSVVECNVLKNFSPLQCSGDFLPCMIHCGFTWEHYLWTLNGLKVILIEHQIISRHSVIMLTNGQTSHAGISLVQSSIVEAVRLK